MLQGIACSRGIGIGSICLITEQDLKFDNSTITDTASEKIRFEKAIEKFKADTTMQANDIRERLGQKEAEILEGHLVMISDPTMSGEMEKMIATGQCAEAAVSAVSDMFIGMFGSMEDDMMRQRAADIRDIKDSLLKILLGIEDIDIALLPQGTILVTKDLTPSMTSRINKDNISGIITEIGGKTSHTAILARALEIPAVLSVPDITALVKNKDTAIVDGSEGKVFVNPDGEVLSSYLIKRENFIRLQGELHKFRGVPTKTKDGTDLEVYCNIGTPRDAKKAIECDGEGIGLFRSEFLFMDAIRTPSEDDQFNSYKEAVETMGDKTVIIRTLDIGGDKDIPYLNIAKEDNPFLGYRAIRYCLGNQDFYKTQLRAILRASAFGKIKIMVPLVTCIDELRSVKEIVSELKKELSAKDISFDKDIQIGCMMETASASLIADILAKEADFFSIGTNDLTQYTMSVDRGNANVSYLYSAFQPSVLRSIRNIISEGNNAGIPVGMCGEAASDPMMIPLLISFGLKEFSVNPVQVLATRAAISKWSVEEANALCDKVMSLTSEAEISSLLKKEAR